MFSTLFKEGDTFVGFKKTAGFIFAAAVALNSCLPAFAAETAAAKTKVEVSLDTIQSVMETYSGDIKTITNNWRIAKNNYNDVKDTDDVQEKYYKTQYKIAEAQYGAKVSSQVLSAKQQYLAFCADNEELASMKKSYDVKNAKAAYYNAALAGGYISQNDFNDYTQDAAKAKNSYETKDADVTRERAALRTLLSIPSDCVMDIQPVSDSAFDFSGIAGINYGQDVILMANNDPNIRTADLNYDYTDAEGTDSGTIENSQIALSQTEASEKAAFKKLYDTLQSSYSAYQTETQSYTQAKQTADTENKKSELGYSSQDDADSAALALQSEKSAYFAARNSVYINYLQYTNMKNGLGSISA